MGPFVLEQDEITIGFKGKEGFNVESAEGIVVALDITLTEDLKKEGFARDLVRIIQEMRKEADYQVDDRIYVSIKAEGVVKDAVEVFADYIKKETLAEELQQSGDMDSDNEKTVEMDGLNVKIAVKKVA